MSATRLIRQTAGLPAAQLSPRATLAEDSGRAVLGLPCDAAASAKPPASLATQIAAYERTLIVETVRLTGGKASEVCRILGISRQTFYEKLAKHGLRRESYRKAAGT